MLIVILALLSLESIILVLGKLYILTFKEVNIRLRV
jgi:hypothetical protein